MWNQLRAVLPESMLTMEESHTDVSTRTTEPHLRAVSGHCDRSLQECLIMIVSSRCSIGAVLALQRKRIDFSIVLGCSFIHLL